MPGGIEFNGRQLFDDGQREIDEIRTQMLSTYEIPPLDLIGVRSYAKSIFLNGSVGEQNLIQSLVNEQLRMYGVEVYYIPRKYITKNTVIREVIESKFNDAYPIEAYIDNFEGYGGQGTVLSKFGIQEQDDLT